MSTAPQTIPRPSLQSINPFNGEVLKTYPEMNSEEISAAISRADEIYKTWRKTTFSERAAILLRVATLYRERPKRGSRL